MATHMDTHGTDIGLEGVVLRLVAKVEELVNRVNELTLLSGGVATPKDVEWMSKSGLTNAGPIPHADIRRN